jgi:hypothetical protein
VSHNKSSCPPEQHNYTPTPPQQKNDKPFEPQKKHEMSTQTQAFFFQHTHPKNNIAQERRN